jgi:hypothetical protein
LWSEFLSKISGRRAAVRNMGDLPAACRERASR